MPLAGPGDKRARMGREHMTYVRISVFELVGVRMARTNTFDSQASIVA
jgi:hypothetical protein